MNNKLLNYYVLLNNSINSIKSNAPSNLDTFTEVESRFIKDENTINNIQNVLTTCAPINNPIFTGTVVIKGTISGITPNMIGTYKKEELYNKTNINILNESIYKKINTLSSYISTNPIFTSLSNIILSTVSNNITLLNLNTNNATLSNGTFNNLKLTGDISFNTNNLIFTSNNTIKFYNRIIVYSQV